MRCPCHDYEERAAIEEYDAHMTRERATFLARQYVCIRCDEAKRWGLLEKLDDERGEG